MVDLLENRISRRLICDDPFRAGRTPPASSDREGICFFAILFYIQLRSDAAVKSSVL
jgi:hypothetical protein